MRLRPNILILGLAGMILITFGIAWAQSASTVEPELTALAGRCGSCHAMEEQVAAWQQGSHREVGCTECHADAGIFGYLHQQVSQSRMAYVQKTGEPPPADILTDIPDRRCLECHGSEMPFVMQDIAPPPQETPRPLDKSILAQLPVRAAHDLHLSGSPSLRCTDCHTEVAHVAPDPLDVTGVAMHKRCQDCHDQKNVKLAVRTSVSCTACHLDRTRITPENHNDSVLWRRDHGAASTGQTCGTCHLEDGLGPHTLVSRPEAFPRPLQDSCLTCHGTPMPHPKNWITQHTGAFTSSAQTCTGCHATKGQGFRAVPAVSASSLPNQGACKECHGEETPHPSAYLSVHGTRATLSPGSCQTCHSSANPVAPAAPHASQGFCTNCHNAYDHPKGWVATHGAKVTNSCNTCHTPQFNACSDCHTGGTWHPPYWFIKHGPAVAQQGKTSCMKCHEYVQPSCSKCHRNP